MRTQQTALELDFSAVTTAEVAASEPIVLAQPATITPPSEPKGVVYTKPWVVDLILDLAGYRSTVDLAERFAVEPSSGEGAFLVPMIRRLLDSLQLHGRPLTDAKDALRAYELDDVSATRAIELAMTELRARSATPNQAREMAARWVRTGDYLLSSLDERRADFVLGNPPYIRYDDIPEGAFAAYRRIFPTMVGRCDIYVGFIEAGVRQLAAGGALGFICADRWMRSAYGVELRRLITHSFGVEVVIEMHNAPAFENDVSAYPAVIIIRKAPQGSAIVASAGATAGPLSDGRNLADALVHLAGRGRKAVPGFVATRVSKWFSGSDPWPSTDPARLELLQRLESECRPLEDAETGTKIGIGVATGADRVYVTKDADAVEADRLLPLAMAADTRSGEVKWSGHYLVDPWDEEGSLVDLSAYPKLAAYFDAREDQLQRRNIAKRNPRGWYRTIDRVHHRLLKQPKLYFPDMKMESNPTLDRGQTYPHHNLYFLTSEKWDLEVLGGLLLSRVAQLFIEAYCVKMRGGTLRFQAQYLRRIRVPDPGSISAELLERLRAAFRERDAVSATSAALEAYGVVDLAGALA